MNKVTIDDIAKVAGVSKSTVSRVLHGKVAVHPDKKNAVLTATRRLGFKPNIVAQSLASGRSMTIGVLTQNMGSPFYDAIAQGVIAGLSNSNYSPIFADGQWQIPKELSALQSLVGRRVDGLVLIGGGISSQQLEDSCEGLPTVIVARTFEESYYRCISMDNAGGGYAVTRHLLDRGHRKIAIIRGLPHHADAIERYQGYCRAIKEFGLVQDPRLVVESDFSPASGITAVNELIKRGETFTAIFAANDLTAFGARLALDQHGLRVPGDVSLIGFDDQLESAYMTPPLTTYRQPAREMGQYAATAILKLLQGEVFTSIQVPGELIIRQSVRDLSAATAKYP